MLKEKYKKSLWIVFDKSSQTIEALKAALQDAPGSWSMTICAGAGKLLGDLYMSVENILRLFIEGVHGEKIVKDESWHKRLIDAGNAKELLPLGIDDTLQNMRNFRHRLLHGYGLDMDEDKLRTAIPEAIAVYEKVEAHIRLKYPELENREKLS
jgi:uncharacterized protein YutE (UPF0331/DUF86 family)